MGAEILLDKPFAFQYRGNGWPGTVRLNGKELPYARASILPFGKRLWTVPGCNICGDSFSQYHADLSLMDPWGEINPSDTQGTTLVTVHTQAGNDIIKTVKNLNLLEKSYKEVIPALGLNDINRKQKLIPYFLGENCSRKSKQLPIWKFCKEKHLRYCSQHYLKCLSCFTELSTNSPT